MQQSAKKRAKDIFGPGGQRNPLKTLDSAKEIQGKTSLFLGSLCTGLARLGRIWIKGAAGRGLTGMPRAPSAKAATKVGLPSPAD
jgi:hypothetical protein